MNIYGRNGHVTTTISDNEKLQARLLRLDIQTLIKLIEKGSTQMTNEDIARFYAELLKRFESII